MTLKKAIFALGILALAAAVNGPAVADEIYPGLSCQPRLGQHAAHLNSYNSDLTNVHSNSQSVNVVCPIVRKNVNSTAPVTVYARMLNVNASTGSTCQILAHDWRGGNPRHSNQATVSGSLNFRGVTLNGPTSHSGGTLYMLCNLSRGSSIINYVVYE